MTQRALTAQDEREEPTEAPELAAAEPTRERSTAAPAQARADGDPAPAEGDDDLSLVVRLHHEVVDTPSPRLALSPAQALHLANEGPARRPDTRVPRHPGGEADATIVLPDARSDTST